MNHKKEVTPEEKLLNLIRRSNKKPSKEKSSAQEHIPAGKESSKSVSASISHKASILKERNFVFAGIKSLNFVLINRVVLLAVFASLLVLTFDLFFHSPDISKIKSSSKVRPMTASLKDDKEIKPYAYYEKEIAKRNLFSSAPFDSQVKRVIPAGPTFKELIKSLELLGIVSGDEPQVIIEDKKLRKTYFLFTGDYLGEIKVEEVYSDRVLLEFKGEKISLFL